MSGVAYPPPNVDIFNSINYNTDFFTAEDAEALLSGYVKKTGSAMTGQLTITTDDATNPQLKIKNTNSTGAAGVMCENDNTSAIAAYTVGCSAGPNYTANNAYIKAVNSLAIATGANNPVANTIPTMIVHSNQNVGIGVSNPSYKLDVNGIIYSSSTITAAAGMAAGSISGGTISTSGKFINSNTNLGVPTTGTDGGNGDKIILYAGGTGVFPYSLGINTGTLWYSVPTGASHNFYTGGTSKMVIAANGKIGIGTAVDALYTLNIASASTGEGLKVQNGSGNGWIGMTAGSSQNPGYITFFNNNNQRVGYIGWQYGVTGYLAMDAEGGYSGYRVNSNFLVGNRVGIGSDVPQTSLDITNPTNPKIFLNQGGTTRSFLSGTSTGLDIGIDVGTSKTIRFMPDSTEKVRINGNGNVGIGTDNPSSILDIYGTSPKLTVRSATESQSSILYLGTPFTSNSALKCALIAEALTSFSRSKLHICLNNTNDNSAIYTAGIADHVATFQYDGNVGIGNSNPMTDGGVTNFFNVGDASVANSIGAIVVGRRDNSGSTRQFRMGLLSDFSFRIGDFGSNNVIGGWTDHIRIEYTALSGALYLDTAGKCNSYGYITYSDIKLKTDIKTINNALWKVQQLRGVYYKHITEGTNNIGLIAQEVEGIVPEAVSYNDKTDTKGVNYSNMVAVLINAIKEQQEIIESQGKTIENILSILSRNNIV